VLTTSILSAGKIIDTECISINAYRFYSNSSIEHLIGSVYEATKASIVVHAGAAKEIIPATFTFYKKTKQ
jgi:hypothetical protein